MFITIRVQFDMCFVHKNFKYFAPLGNFMSKNVCKSEKRIDADTKHTTLEFNREQNVEEKETKNT